MVGGGDHLELVRTLELLAQVLPPPPARLLDVGGGPGVYASRLARAGYDVELVDVLPLHVEQARELAAAQPEAAFEAAVADRATSRATPTEASTRCCCSDRSTT